MIRVGWGRGLNAPAERLGVACANPPHESGWAGQVLDASPRAETVTLTPNQYRSEVRFSGYWIALQAGLKASLQGKFVWCAPV